MLLAIDIGNTNTVLGVWDGDRLRRSWRIKTDARSTADELAKLLPEAIKSVLSGTTAVLDAHLEGPDGKYGGGKAALVG